MCKGAREFRVEPRLMSLLVARQPILDIRKSTVAYELLFRSESPGISVEGDPDLASSQVVYSTLFDFGLRTLVGSRTAFINMTRNSLVREDYAILPTERVTLELLETVDPDSDVIDACAQLKARGYGLALDDFVYRDAFVPLLELADIVKVDVLAAEGKELAKLTERLSSFDVRLLAEKVETEAMFRETEALGYEMFQGYFFCRPETVSTDGMPASKVSILRFLREVNRSEMDFRALEKIIKQEYSLSLKLLRFLNSASYGLRKEVTSIMHALVMIGEEPMRRWASILALTEIGDDVPPETVITGVIRARVCEQLAGPLGDGKRQLDYFLVGLLSVVDVLLARPMADVLAEISVSALARDALLGGKNQPGLALELVCAYQRGDWDRTFEIASQLDLPAQRVSEAYREAVAWADEAFSVAV